MSELSVNQVVQTAGDFQNLANQNGGMFVLGGEQTSRVSVGDIRYFSPPDKPEFQVLKDIAAQGAGIVSVRTNFDQLAVLPGREFGLLQPGVGIRPAIISPRSRPSGLHEEAQLHIVFLAGERDLIDPANIADGAADPLNGMLLQTAKTLYGPTIAAHGDGGAVLSGEIGHRYGGLRILSDPNIREASLQGIDVTDGLATQGKGMAANLTASGVDSRDRDVPGAFDIVDVEGKIRRIPYATAMLGPDSTAILIDHALFNQDTRSLLGGMAPEVAATGLAIVAKISREDPVDATRAAKRYGEQALGLQ